MALLQRIANYLMMNCEKAVCRSRILALRATGVTVPNSAVIGRNVEIKVSGGSVHIGNRTSLDKGVILRTYGGSITLGNNCSVNPYSILYGHGGLTIGNGVRIAANVVIIPANHIFDDPDRYIYEQGETTKGIVIEDDVWIGAGVCILDGVTISRGCVIAAGAVVTMSTEAYGVYGGVPARKIRIREKQGAQIDGRRQ